jgi:GntR family transcriptional regulator
MKQKENKQIRKFRKAPEYQRMVDEIKERINSGELKPGDLLASEAFLCEEYNLNRSTVNKALAVLNNEGYVFSITDKGIYIAQRNYDPYALCFDELTASDKKYEEVKIIEVNVVRASNEVCVNLKIHRNKHVVLIKRVYLNEKRAKIFEVTYVPYYRGIPIVEREINFSEFPEKVIVKKITNPMTKKLSIKAGIVNGEVKQIFDADDGEAVLIVEQKKFDDRNVPISWTRLYFYGEVNKLSAVANL